MNTDMQTVPGHTADVTAAPQPRKWSWDGFKEGIRDEGVPMTGAVLGAFAGHALANRLHVPHDVADQMMIGGSGIGYGAAGLANLVADPAIAAAKGLYHKYVPGPAAAPLALGAPKVANIGATTQHPYGRLTDESQKGFEGYGYSPEDIEYVQAMQRYDAHQLHKATTSHASIPGHMVGGGIAGGTIGMGAGLLASVVPGVRNMGRVPLALGGYAAGAAAGAGLGAYGAYRQNQQIGTPGYDERMRAGAMNAMGLTDDPPVAVPVAGAPKQANALRDYAAAMGRGAFQGGLYGAGTGAATGGIGSVLREASHRYQNPDAPRTSYGTALVHGAGRGAVTGGLVGGVVGAATTGLLQRQAHQYDAASARHLDRTKDMKPFSNEDDFNAFTHSRKQFETEVDPILARSDEIERMGGHARHLTTAAGGVAGLYRPAPQVAAPTAPPISPAEAATQPKQASTIGDYAAVMGANALHEGVFGAGTGAITGGIGGVLREGFNRYKNPDAPRTSYVTALSNGVGRGAITGGVIGGLSGAATGALMHRQVRKMNAADARHLDRTKDLKPYSNDDDFDAFTHSRKQYEADVAPLHAPMDTIRRLDDHVPYLATAAGGVAGLYRPAQPVAAHPAPAISPADAATQPKQAGSPLHYIPGAAGATLGSAIGAGMAGDDHSKRGKYMLGGAAMGYAAGDIAMLAPVLVPQAVAGIKRMMA